MTDTATAKPAPAAIMFSGGTDSTLAAALMLEEGRDVHLLTFNPGFVLFIGNSRYNAGRLKEVYGDHRVTHAIMNNVANTKEILWNEIKHDLKEFGFNMNALVCLGCRMAMHTGAVIYCLENGIPYLVDGSIADQSTIPEQLQSTLERHREFYRETFGMHHRSPIYDEARSDNRLAQMGMEDQRDLKKQFILFDTQGTCPLGVTADVYARMFYKWMYKTRETDAKTYGQAKYPLMVETVEKHFNTRGEDFKDYVNQLKELKGLEDGH